MTRQQLMRNITAAELQEWQILYQLEPWGDRRRDINTAQLAQLLVQMMADEQSRKSVTLETFLLDWWGEARQRKARDEWGRFKMLAERINEGFRKEQENAQGTGPKSRRDGRTGPKPEKPGQDS